MKIVPLAADSLGVRSMATYVECGQTRVLIDPGASLGHTRFNLPPSDEEWEALKRANDRISAYATRADVVFVSHYHEDHFRYDPTIYQDKNVWVKDPKRMVGARQAGRAALLCKGLQGRCRLDAAEGRRLETPDVVLAASPPLSHGVDGTALGYVVALTITDRREGQRFVHASDVQGPLSPVALAYLMREHPDVLYLSGPPAYLESQIGSAPIDRGIDHLVHIIESTGCRAILDHHAIRAPDYRERFRRVWETGRVQTAAAFLGLADAPLEARRRELWSARRKPPAPMPMRPRRLNEKRSSTMIKPRGAPDLAKEGTTQ
jgi:predicted metallo-beta-lactamase superfamily hydrolase